MRYLRGPAAVLLIGSIGWGGVLLGGYGAQAETQATACQQEAGKLLSEGRNQVRARNLLSAVNWYYQPLADSPHLLECLGPDRRKFFRDFAHALALLAQEASGKVQASYRQRIVEQLTNYIEDYRGDTKARESPDELASVRSVVTSLAKVLLDSERYDALHDYFAQLATSNAEVFHAASLNYWKDALKKWARQKSSADPDAESGRWSELCVILKQTTLELTTEYRNALKKTCQSKSREERAACALPDPLRSSVSY